VSAIQIRPQTEKSITAVQSVLTGSGAGLRAPTSLAFCMVIWLAATGHTSFMIASRRAPRTLGGRGRGTKVRKRRAGRRRRSPAKV
jgi:hypothetical protein